MNTRNGCGLPVGLAMCAVLMISEAALGQERRSEPPPQTRSQYVRTERVFPGGVILERLAPAEVRRNAPFTYELRITNQGSAAIEDVVLTETLAASFSPIGTTPAAARREGSRLVWQFRSLAPGRTESVQIRGSTNRAEDMTACAVLAFQISSCSTTRVVEPALQLVKRMPPSAMICDEIPIRITVSNTGTGVARDVRVNDVLPDGLLTLDGRNAFEYLVGDLAAGQSREFSIGVRAARRGSFTNVARAAEAGGQPVEASASVTVRQPVLAVQKSGPATRFLGRPAVFEITVRNTGDAPANDTVLTDTLPSGLEFVSAEDGGALSGGRVQWNLGVIDPGAQRTVRVTMVPRSATRVENVATARAYCAEGTASFAMDARGVPAILLECVDDPDPIEVGQTVTYTITVTNQGTAPDRNTVVEVVVPAEQEFVQADGATRGDVQGRTIRFAPYPVLAPKQRIQYQVLTRGRATGDSRFRVTLTSDVIRTPVEETESTHIY